MQEERGKISCTCQPESRLDREECCKRVDDGEKMMVETHALPQNQLAILMTALSLWRHSRPQRVTSHVRVRDCCGVPCCGDGEDVNDGTRGSLAGQQGQIQ